MNNLAVVKQLELRKSFEDMTNIELSNELRKLKDNEGIPYSEMSKQIGYDRATISTMANKATCTDKVRAAIVSFLNSYYAPEDSIEEIQEEVQVFETELKLFPTVEFSKALGFIEKMRVEKKMGCMIGYPGSGKTTVVKEYIKRNENVVYVEAFSGMREKDLLEIIADNLGISLRGSRFKQFNQIVTEYDGREIMFIIDEAEYLKKWDVSKFDTLRKIWDNTGIPILFVGTKVLEDYLTHGGNGKENLAQLYRRIHQFKLEGIKEAEVRTILSNYNIGKEATNILTALAIDYKNGGMGNFTEVFEACLNETGGGEITPEIARNAKKYKMLLR